MNFDAMIEAIQEEIQMCHGHHEDELAIEPEENETHEELFAIALVKLTDAMLEDRAHYADEYWGS